MKPLTLSTLLFSCFLSTSFAQTGKLKFSAAVYPNMSSGIITNDGSVPGSVETGYQDWEEAKPSISGTLFTEYSLGKRAQLLVGVGYQNNGERTEKFNLTFSQPDPAASPIKSMRFRYNRHNLEIPVLFRFYFTKRFYGIAGTSALFNLYNTSGNTRWYENGKKSRDSHEDTSTDFRVFNFSANFGLGFDFVQQERFALFVQPYLQYGVLGVSKNASLNRNFLSSGISVGIRLADFPFRKKAVVSEGS